MEKPFPAYQGNRPYVFVCYAHEDSAAVYPEISWLRDQGINIWYDEGISPGTRWSDELADALTRAALVLFFCTPESVKSEHCQDEIAFALDENRPLIMVQHGAVDLPPGMRLQMGSHQAILAHELSTQQFADKLFAAIGRYTEHDSQQAEATLKSRAVKNRALRYVVPVTVAAVVAGSLWILLLSRTDDRQVRPQDAVPTEIDPSIAVLPFRTLSSEPAVLTFADGLVDELVNELSGHRLETLRRFFPLIDENGLKVAPVTSTRRYRNTDEDPASIGKSLEVAYLVDGSVRPGDGALRVTLQLIRAADNEQVWSQTYDRALGEPLAVQASIARHAAWSVTATIPNDFWYRSVRAQFSDAAAHHFFVRAHRGSMQYYRGDDVDLVAIAKNYERSLELDPAFMFTYRFLITTYLDHMTTSIEPIETVAPIDVLLTQLSGLIGSRADINALPLPHLRARYSLLRFDYESADRYARQALNKNPNNIGAHATQGILSLHMGNLDDARASYRRAIDAGGAIPRILLLQARMLQASGQHVGAAEFIESVLDFVPGDYGTCRLLLDQAAAFAALGDLERATKLVDQAWTLCGSRHPEIFPAALVTTARVDRAVAILHKLEVEGSRRHLNPVDMIDAYVALGDLDSTFRWINEGIDATHFGVVTWMYYSRTDQRLLDDPRWRQAWSRLPEVPII